YTLEEVVSRDFLLNENPDVIIDLVDATNIERNLYLTTQLIETGVPVVIALNMADLLEKRGIKIDVERLSMLLNCPIVETSALKGKGLDEVVEEAIKVAKKNTVDLPKEIFSKDVEAAIAEVKNVLPSSISEDKRRWYAVKFLENDSKVAESVALSGNGAKVIEDNRTKIEKAEDDDMESIVTDGRYQFIQKIVSTTVKKSGGKLTISDKIDRIVTNRILGIPIFIAIMFVVYYISVTTIGTLVTDWTNDTFVAEMIQPAAQSFLKGIGASAAIQDLIVNGIIGGLGAVLGFVPQMAILFLFLSILEDCGYMVRIAFVMDRVFRHFGLSGKSFIPLLISSGCGIPGIMASKTIEQDNDRRLTIMTATFIPWGAKLPVIAMMGGVMTSYATGSYEAGGLMHHVCTCWYRSRINCCNHLKEDKTIFRKPAPFVMELPQYHIPSAKTVLLHVWERLKGFIIKAGTILFLACVVMWFLSGYGFVNGSFGAVEDPGNSLLAVIGGAIAPIFAPLGFDNWKAVAASLSGFSAKESIVSTMGVLANVTGDASEDAVTVAEAVRTWFPSAVAAFSFLLFNLLDSPCLAAISTMAKEMQSRKWFWFAILFQNIFSYVVTLIVYQIGTFATGGAFTVGTAVGIVLLLVMLFLLFRPDPYKDQKVYSKRSVQA
ncbi:MAG: ferrous iron transport protein B, partial [Anaerostipes hadrus]